MNEGESAEVAGLRIMEACCCLADSIGSIGSQAKPNKKPFWWF
jgi:hypothetical protein